MLKAAIAAPRVSIAGDCRPVVDYAAGFGRLRSADQHLLLAAALAELVVDGWVVDWCAIPRSLNGEAHAL
eukprot:3807729-Alexandrium_andersonii.AAC.1